MSNATFYSRGFAWQGPLMEWDGTNHEEILDWLNEASSVSVWFIDEVTTSQLTFAFSPTSYRVTFQLNDWIQQTTQGPARTAAPKAGRWIAQDPDGRAPSIDNLVVPAEPEN
jgi:hypothetical protein